MKVLVTGGAGFIGVNTVLRYRERGDEVVAADNLSKSAIFLPKLEEAGARFEHADVRFSEDMDRIVAEGFDLVFHLAAQTAVTTSIEDPVSDFEANAWGTLNLLEGVRMHCPKARVIFNSTNKVFGDLAHRGVEELAKRYALMARGDPTHEDEPLDFLTPYGTSKGTADQYVRDYGRTYSLDTVVLRLSCIYGPRQLGTEDQGWMAWLALAALRGDPINVYGTGKQVRDVLYVDDLMDLYELVGEIDDPEDVYNIGGGAANTVSVLEYLEMLEEVTGKGLDVSYHDERPGDQRVYVSGNRRAEKAGWRPTTSLDEGLPRLVTFLKELHGV